MVKDHVVDFLFLLLFIFPHIYIRFNQGARTSIERETETFRGLYTMMIVQKNNTFSDFSWSVSYLIGVQGHRQNDEKK